MQMESNNIPSWMVTFADLMALMMTFFVLLYSFSKIDEEKYKSIVNSMATGFDGVQWIKRQLTHDEIIGPQPGIVAPPKPEVPALPVESPEKPQPEKTDTSQTEKSKPEKSRNDVVFNRLKNNIAAEIKAGLVIVERRGNNIVIRFPEKVSFPSGSDRLVENFKPVISRIGTILAQSQGVITISGHTDDRPISTTRFRSNWELSAARAVSVAHALLRLGDLDKHRIVVSGHADTRPLAKNDSDENRAKNRRVEIVIMDESRV